MNSVGKEQPNQPGAPNPDGNQAGPASESIRFARRGLADSRRIMRLLETSGTLISRIELETAQAEADRDQITTEVIEDNLKHSPDAAKWTYTEAA